MNQDVMKGQWTQLKGKLRRQWGKLTNDDMDVIQGDKDILIGKIQEYYGRTRDEAEAELNDFLDNEPVTA
jgi:uncharacterized protein YjbJ (UPF0337 family)